MKQTAVEWLVGKILTKDEIYDDYGNVIGYKLINTFTSSEDFSKYVEQAKAMEKKEKLKHQLFIGKVAEILGFDKTVELLKQCNDEII